MQREKPPGNIYSGGVAYETGQCIHMYAILSFDLYYIGVGTGGGGGGGGGSGGTCPHKLQVGGAVPPQPGCCTRPDYDSFHEYRQLQSILYLTYSSFLHCYNQETLVYLSQVQTLASLMQKWVWFLRNVGVVQNSVYGMLVHAYLMPPQRSTSSYASVLGGVEGGRREELGQTGRNGPSPTGWLAGAAMELLIWRKRRERDRERGTLHSRGESLD